MVWQIVGNPTFYVVSSTKTPEEFNAVAAKYGKPVLSDGKGQFFIADGVIFRFLPMV